MAEGSRLTVYYVKETQSGVTPASPKLNIFRATKSTLDINVNTLESAELRDDAETADFRLGTRHVEGTVTGEVSYGTFDDLFAAALRSSWATDKVKGGVERQSFTFITFNADLPDDKYTIYRGCEINTISLQLSAEAITVADFGIVGREMEIAKALPTGATINPRTTTSPMDAFSGTLTQDGKSVANVTEISLELDNGIEPRFVVGSKFSIKPGAKRRNVNGSMNTYYESVELKKKFLDEQEVSLSFTLSDGKANTGSYVFSMPRIKFTEAPTPVDGEGDIMLNAGYKALLSAKDGYSIQITRVPPVTGP
ncbi:hypothetical protein PQD09_gp29 [Providencia phage PSTCR4]|uniref:Major tail protein n=1 Tax=Providencia phage PSTCR4 TaxID=2783546 RepID=A0A873WHG4_9CAUD|nr:hypothetical protein PQD09_gp29 [Providencia phage PSTCR4]QPB12050.1 hypothetical protein [Providencia phage PSTCR4]